MNATLNTRPLLVVDDDDNNRNLLSRRLRSAGYYVEVAEGGREAIALMETVEMDLVLLDIMMPDMSGVELLRILRAKRSASQLPVIMVTALGESRDIVEALSLGANDYITKPVDMAVALARIETLLRRRRVDDELADSRDRLALALRGSNDGLWDWDLRRDTVYYSARWQEMLGIGPEDELGVSPEEWLRRVHRDDIADLRRQLTASQLPDGPGDFLSEHRLQHSDGSWRWMLCRAVVQRSFSGTALRMAGCITDVNQTKARDPLTGLPNRLAFHEYVQEVLVSRRTVEGANFAVYFIDLDRFKLINDSLGHAAGDQLLLEIAHRLEKVVRSSKDGVQSRRPDALARLGGDEFALLVEDVNTADEARALGARLLEEIAAGSRIFGKELFTTASIGVVLGSAEYTISPQLVRDADTAMYRAKALGKNRCELFDSAMRADAVFRLEMVNDLQRALSRQEFEIYYQPKVAVAEQRVTGFEALLRWHHPVRGLVPPAQFIPIAEETGLIVPLGLWVLEEACRTMHRWHSEFPSDPPLDISVNFSVRQLRQPDVLDEIEAILARTGIARETIQLEVTESILIEDPQAARQILTRLKTLGVGLKIDDLATGFSTLRQLVDMRFDSLKIDRSFIENLCDGNAGENMVRTIIELAKNLGIRVIAEGVETAGQLNKLTLLGCDRVQGHYFSAALTKDEAVEMLKHPGQLADSAPLH